MAFTKIRPSTRNNATPSGLWSLGSILKENRNPAGGLTEFANVLLHVAIQLTKDEFAIMKLGLIASDKMLAKQADNITCAADLLSFMYTRKLVDKDDMNLLMDLLVKVYRMDIHETVYNYHLKQQPESGITPNLQKEVLADSFLTGEQGLDLMEDEADPNSQNSQSSLSDDDKIYQLEKQKSNESFKMDTSSQ